MKAWPKLVPLAALLAGLWACDDRVAGGSTEVGNSEIAGVLSTVDGAPAQGARVALVPPDFDACADSLPTGSQAIADGRGGYHFPGARAGTYNLHAVSGGTAVLVRGLRVPPDSAGKADLRLAETGTVAMPLPDSSAGYAYLPGTLVCGHIDASASSARRLVLQGVPAGRYDRLMRVTAGHAPVNLLGRPLDVAAGGDRDLGPYAAWSVKRRIAFDLTGAIPAADVAGLPVPVRLRAPDFDFAKAAKDGADLRFTAGDGLTPLPYEIESWDAASGNALAWVRTDRIPEGSKSLSLSVFTGNADAPAASDGRAVFDTADGFSGAWHLGAGLEDATAHQDGGSDHGTQAAEGILGAARSFDGTAHVAIPDSPALRFGSGDFTLSAWIAPDAFGSNAQVLAKRDLLVNYEIQVSPGGRVSATLDPKGDTTRFLFTPSPAPLGDWIHIAFVRAGGKVYLYENGSLVAGPMDMPDSAGPVSEVWIGDDPAFGKGEGFKGRIDEVEISGAARGADWIALEARTRAPGAAVLQPPE